MLKVLLVDDEPGAIKSLKYLIDWEEHGFTVAGEAENAEEALEELRRMRYSIMITDIRMPGMNGLDLIENIRTFSKLRTIVVSGYNEFFYVKKCLDLRVEDYLLKPVAEDDLLRLLKQVKQAAEAESKLDKKMYLSIPALKNQRVKLWTEGLLTPREIQEMYQLFDLDMERHVAYGCFAVEMDFFEAMDSSLTTVEIQTKCFAVKNVLEEVLGVNGFLLEESVERLGVIYSWEDAEVGQEQMEALARKMCDAITHYTKGSITIGVGGIVALASDVAESYALAKKMLDRKFLMGHHSILASDSHFLSGTDRNDGMNQMVDQVIKAVKFQDRADLTRTLQNQLNGFRQLKVAKSTVQSICLELLVCLFQCLREMGYDVEFLFRSSMEDYKMIINSKTIESLFDFIQSKCTTVIDHMAAMNSTEMNNPVASVKKIVAEHFAEHLNLKSIAMQIHINPAYLGQMFRMAEGISFNDYLLKVRIEASKTLLKYSDKKVYEIAFEVGYKEIDWFYKKFKEFTGISASEFRKQYKANRV